MTLHQNIEHKPKKKKSRRQHYNALYSAQRNGGMLAIFRATDDLRCDHGYRVMRQMIDSVDRVCRKKRSDRELSLTFRLCKYKSKKQGRYWNEDATNTLS